MKELKVIKVNNLKKYIVNNKPNGEHHEVHTVDCGTGGSATDVTKLGWYLDCKYAVKVAEALLQKPTDGCGNCSPKCNKAKIEEALQKQRATPHENSGLGFRV